MVRTAAVFGTATIVAVVVISLLFFEISGGNTLVCSIRRSLILGRPLLAIEAPIAGSQVPPGGLGVLVSFDSGDRVASATFRALLNDRDVTNLFTVGTNGAAGTIYPLRDGANRLRVEVFGRGLWSRRLLEDAAEVGFRARAAGLLDRG
jgi:hypothetical protein